MKTSSCEIGPRKLCLLSDTSYTKTTMLMMMIAMFTYGNERDFWLSKIGIMRREADRILRVGPRRCS